MRAIDLYTAIFGYRYFGIRSGEIWLPKIKFGSPTVIFQEDICYDCSCWDCDFCSLVPRTIAAWAPWGRVPVPSPSAIRIADALRIVRKLFKKLLNVRVPDKETEVILVRRADGEYFLEDTFVVG